MLYGCAFKIDLGFGVEYSSIELNWCVGDAFDINAVSSLSLYLGNLRHRK